MKIDPQTTKFEMHGIVWRRQGTGYFTGGKAQKFHRVHYEQTVGPIPPGFHIHHIDEDKLNNHPSNLRVVTPREHRALHRDNDMRAIQKAIAVVRRTCNLPEKKTAFRGRILTMWKNRAPREIRCIVCGNVKETTCMKPVLYCSTRCKQRAKRQQPPNQ